MGEGGGGGFIVIPKWRVQVVAPGGRWAQRWVAGGHPPYGEEFGRAICRHDVAFEGVEVGLEVIGTNAVHMGSDVGRLAGGRAEQRQKDAGPGGGGHLAWAAQTGSGNQSIAQKN